MTKNTKEAFQACVGSGIIFGLVLAFDLIGNT